MADWGASRFWRHTYLLDHDGNRDRARDYGSSRFVRSQVERRDLVHAGLGRDVTLGRKGKGETGERETVTNFVNSPVLLARKVSLLINSVFLEEVANFVARCKKVVVTNVILFARGEFGLWEMSLG